MALMTKTEIMAHVAAGEIHETFDHETEGSFDITMMRKLAHAAWTASLQANLKLAGSGQPLVKPDVELRRFHMQGMEAAIRASRVIDETRIMQLDDYSWRNDPALVVEYVTDGTEYQLIIDGTHRILRRSKEGKSTFDAYVFTTNQIIRPDMNKFVQGVKRGYDWGDDVVDGKIIKRVIKRV